MTAIAPRLMTKAQAAEYCSLTESGFSEWVRQGRLPARLKGTQRWDRAAIDAALDRLSGIAQRSAIAVADEYLKRYDENQPA